MPPILLFGREWRTSSDDLVCPAVTELLVRLNWVVVVTAVLVFHVRETYTLQCLGEEYGETTLYLAITLAILVTTCVLQALLALHSGRGSLSDSSPRRWVPTILYVNVMLTVAESLWTVLGTFFTVNDFINCREEEHARSAIVAVLVVVCLSYVLIGMKVTVAVLSWRPSEGTTRALNYRSLRCLMPCARQEGHVQAFRDIATLLSKIFNDKNLVASDVAAALVILGKKHQVHRSSRGEQVHAKVRLLEVEAPTCTPASLMEESPIPAPPLHPSISWDKLVHYYLYASAAYGYWWYVMQAPCAHTCSLGSYLNCVPWACCLRQRVEGLVEGDGACHCNTAAMQAMLGTEPADILLVDNRNHIQEVPFFLVADRSTLALVVSIRGTLSLADMLTDLRGEPVTLASCLPELGLPQEWRGHEGIARSATHVFRRLHDDRRVLEAALEQTNYTEVVVTGHSLGAGTAAILAFLLRARYPTLTITCYSYSPPGGLLCPSAAAASGAWCTSLVVGDDVIPRTSLTNIHALAQAIRHVCRRCELAKHAVFGYGLLGCCTALCSCLPITTANLGKEAERLFPHSPPSPSTSTGGSSSSLLPGVEGATVLPMEERGEEECVEHCSFPVMLPPGRIVHITPGQRGGYEVAEVAQTSFDELLISPRMLADHMPSYLYQVLNSFAAPPAVAPLLV